ncbi:hypothetical protein HYU23_03580 [Candidatus Woesearchaeota archaeon]|nr:hypothetical protein [Candidatus Woesearchaeota archaeon]
MPEEDIKEIIEKYKAKVEKYVDVETEGAAGSESLKAFSKEYLKFREEVLSKKVTRYEKWCSTAENIIKLKPSEKILPKLQEAINTSHLNITPAGAASFAALASLLIIFLGALISVAFYLISNEFPIFTLLMFLIIALVALNYFNKLPIYLATRWRLRASNQMVLAILYIVIYMRHTSNLEHAIKFAAQHIETPLSLDLRKIFWDMETGKFPTIKESIDNYLETWRHYNLEFVTAFHLIESSLYEPTESRRNDLLDKGLNVILEGTYEKMLHYAQDVKGPVTTLHMLGVILPILGLVVFPLIGAFLQGLVKWYHLAFLYNIVLPILVFSLGMNILSKRPTGYGESKVAEKVYEKAFDPFWLCFFVAGFLIIIGLFPLLFQAIETPKFAPNQKCAIGDIDLGSILGCFFGYVGFGDSVFGPFGIGALLLSFFIPAGVAVGLGLYYKLKSKKVIELRNETKQLESEFASALFQLGNRVGDGIPVELAFSKVAQTMEGTPSGNFFKLVDTNIRQLGMGVEEAIFNEKNGAILAYPSPLIESSMEVLLESSRKGPHIVSQSLISISTYIDRIHKVAERLKDLLAEVISSMKAQISFLTPAIAGIVVGISSMIVNIIVALNLKISSFTLESGAESAGTAGGLTTIVDLFKIDGIIPGYFFQLVVGIYVVQLAYILTIMQNGIENGTDKINEQHLLGTNLIRSFLIYAVIALIVTVLFSSMAQGLLSQELTG